MTSVRTWLAVVGIAVLGGVFAPSAQAQKKDVALGPHLGVNFDVDDLLLGMHARFDVVDVTPEVRLQIYPNLSYYFIDNGDLFNLSCDVPFEFVIHNSMLRPYAAPGLAFLYWNGPNNDDLDLGLDLLGGLVFELDSVEPWIEVRFILHGGTMAELRGGVQFVL